MYRQNYTYRFFIKCTTIQNPVKKTRQRGDMIFFKYLKGCPTEEGQDLFSIIPECRTHNNGLKLQEGKCRVNFKKNLLTVRAV